MRKRQELQTTRTESDSHMDILIDSASVLRKKMGRHYAAVRALDPLPAARARVSAIKRKLIGDAPITLCRYCRRPLKYREVKCAHIVPLGIGGLPPDDCNVILLCATCHDSYDRSGALSIAGMQQVAARWQEGVRPRRTPLLTPKSPHKPTIVPGPRSVRATLSHVLDLQRGRQYPAALNVIRRRLADANLGNTARVCLLIKRAEITRRGSGKGVIEQALYYLEAIDPAEVPAKYKPVFYYELGYVNRLLGRPDRAAGFMALSTDASRGLARTAYVAARANEIACQVARLDELDQLEANAFACELRALGDAAMEEGGYWGGRWAANCAALALQVRIKAADDCGSRADLPRVLSACFNLDARNGWDLDSLPTVSMLRGLVLTLFPESCTDLDVGIGLLARSFVGCCSGRARFEGVRDVGFALALGLERKHGSAAADLVASLREAMYQTVDSTSILWPWKET